MWFVFDPPTAEEIRHLRKAWNELVLKAAPRATHPQLMSALRMRLTSLPKKPAARRARKR
jgi:hypothetical protein